jgi:hypothetical protein
MKRDYNVFTKKDWPKLLFIVIFYPTIIIPFLRAIKGFIKKPDPAWFLHLIVCPAFVIGYGIFFARKYFSPGKITNKKGN